MAGSTCNGEDGIREIAGLNPNVVLIETKIKQADGIDSCRRAPSADDQAIIAVFTSYLDPDERRLSLQVGVDGYLLKDVDTDNLANWIKVVVQQQSDEEANDIDCDGFGLKPTK